MSNFQASFQLADNIDQDKIFLVNLSDIEGRIDPSPYKSAFSFQSKIFPSFKLNKIAFINPTTAFPIDQDAIYSFIPMDAVSDKNGNIEYILEKPITEIKGFTKFKSGDLIWAKITPCMQNGKSAVVKETTEYVCGSTEFHVIRPRNDELNIEYIHFILRDTRILEAAKNFFGGSAGQQRVSDIFLKTLNIPLPPKHIQNKFVELWNETKRLSIEKKLEAQNLLDSINDYLLTELDIKVPDVDNSLSNRIFTVQASELSGGRFDALQYKSLLKDLILARKDIVDLSHVVLDMKSGIGAGKQDQSNEYEGIIQIRPTNISKGGKLNFTKNVYVNNIPNTLIVKKGDVLFNNTNSQELVGKTAYYDLDEVMSCSNHITRILVDHKKILPKYLGLLLNLYQQNKVFYYLCINWNNQSGVGQDILRKLPIVLPNISKQQEIVQHIDKVRATATQLQQEANEILAQAKQKIERMILGEEQ